MGSEYSFFGKYNDVIVEVKWELEIGCWCDGVFCWDVVGCGDWVGDGEGDFEVRGSSG